MWRVVEEGTAVRDVIALDEELSPPNAIALLEPVMIIFMGVTVGFIVISVIMPLMEMSNLSR